MRLYTAPKKSTRSLETLILDSNNKNLTGISFLQKESSQ